VVLCIGVEAIDRCRATTLINSHKQPSAEDGKPFDQQQKLEELTKQIARQENIPAEEVFKRGAT
jgi:hypothetical protein